MTLIIRESFFIPEKKPDDIYFSIKVWMMSNNAYIDKESTSLNPRLILFAKKSGGIRFMSRPLKDGILTISLDEKEKGTLLNATVESLMCPDFLTLDDTIRGTLFSRLDSLMEFLKTPINPEIYGRYYSEKFIQNQLWEVRSAFIFFSILSVLIALFFNNLTSIGKFVILLFIFPIVLFGISIYKSEKYWAKRRHDDGYL